MEKRRLVKNSKEFKSKKHSLISYHNQRSNQMRDIRMQIILARGQDSVPLLERLKKIEPKLHIRIKTLLTSKIKALHI